MISLHSCPNDIRKALFYGTIVLAFSGHSSYSRNFYEEFEMPTKIIEQQIQKTDLSALELKTRDGALVKAVVDVELAIIIAGMAMHSDGEEILLENGSKQANLWGINLYLQQSADDWIEYDSVINLRPSQGNISRGVDDPAVQQKIRNIINQLVKQA
jgi:hypothetical protein